MRVAIFGRSFPAVYAPHIKHFFRVLKDKQVDYAIHSDFRNFLNEMIELESKEAWNSTDDIRSKVDFLLSIGGDGAMLESAKLVADTGIPILGINTGRLGFLSSVSEENIKAAITELVEGKFTLDKRTLIQMQTRNNLFGKYNFALNEVTIHKKDSSSMIVVHVYINDEILNSYWADGLIVATPTGSTGYSLSCGGPIVSPASGNFIITPIAPHNLNVRPFVVSDDCRITLKVEARGENSLVTLDYRSETIESTTEMQLTKADFHINLVRLSNESFLTTLRNKMMWGADKRN